MENNHPNSPSSLLHKERSKGNQSLTERQRVYNYLRNHIATNAMTSEATGVPRENLCRIKRKLEKAERLWKVFQATCKKTGCKAWYLTTEPKEAPQSNQTTIPFT